MGLIDELKGSLNGYLRWDKRRIDCFVKLMLALITVQNVNMKRVCCAMYGKAKAESSYRRLQRFFSGFRLNYDSFARLLFKLFKFHEGQHFLILDRTNWRWGKKISTYCFYVSLTKKLLYQFIG